MKKLKQESMWRKLILETSKEAEKEKNGGILKVQEIIQLQQFTDKNELLNDCHDMTRVCCMAGLTKTGSVICSGSMSANDKDHKMTESSGETAKPNNPMQLTAIPTQQFPLTSTPCCRNIDAGSLSSLSLSSGISEASSSSTKRSRKSTTPTQSPSLDDPLFSGVKFRFHLTAPSNSTVPTPDTSQDSPELAIEKEYVKVPTLSTRNRSRVDSTGSYVTVPRRRKRAIDFHKLDSPSRDRPSPAQPLDESSSCSSEGESLLPRAPTKNKMPTRNRARGQKICASCQSTKSPMWRDTEEGISLCNACGIRYKRYRSICSRCSYVPRKEERSWKWCKLCGRAR